MSENNMFDKDNNLSEENYTEDKTIISDTGSMTESEEKNAFEESVFLKQEETDAEDDSYYHMDSSGIYKSQYNPYSYENRPSERAEVYINKKAKEAKTGEDKKTNKKEKRKYSFATVSIAVVLCVIFSGIAGFGGAYFASYLNDRNASVIYKTPGDEDQASVIYKSANSDKTAANNTDSTFKEPGTFATVAANVSGSVVEIRTETVSTSSIFSQYITEGAGSGVIITSDGYIITNNHVIDGASTVTVTTTDGTKYPAEVIGYDSQSDLAVLKVEASGLMPAVVGDSSKLVVGEEVLAIGNPLGSLGGTVTNGIISALARQVTIDGTEMTLLQTNAAVNPGNSGGGLFNLSGELVGIVNAKSSGSGIEGLGFAIPSNMASQVVEQLINYGYVRGRVSLGITYMDISDSYTAMMYRVNTLGVYILESEYNDELKIGDRVTAVDGKEITYGNDIKAILKDHKVGDKITLTVVRDGRYVDVEMECHEYVPGKDEKSADNKNGSGGTVTSPFSSWFGY